MSQVRFELAYGVPLVPVHLNGRGPFRFVLDTAASKTIVDSGLARELGLSLGPETMGLGAGGLLPVRLTRIGVLRVGELELRDLEVGVADLSGLSRVLGVRVEGILGYDFFAGAVLTIDYKRRVLRVERASHI